MADVFLSAMALQEVRRFLGLRQYADAYTAVYNDIVGRGDPAVALWFEASRQVNSNTGFYAKFIREYTRKQIEIRGIETTAADPIQDASDKIAIKVLSAKYGDSV
jgi:hypothetical protein